MSTLPMLQAYIDGLPNGLESHPQCKIKGMVLLTFRDNLPDGGERMKEALPEPLRYLVTSNILPSMWLPEVHDTAFCMAIRDVYHRSDAEFVDYIYQCNRALFQKPLYRLLMMVASPKMIVSGVEKRWAQFHQASNLQVNIVSSNEAQVRLDYSPGLFSKLMMTAMNTAYQAAVECAGGKNPSFTIIEYTERFTVTTGRWG